ncbi:uncharacterized protein LOC105420554 [Amborella trichopoda]|uniref:uncharacterized protein LOC105420554 n=1 Tax=Amborella trichopoda TaxID=13333 RepID=UPI0005D40417|nr:uncharacterized protein LOC105420554 [Amborella trichopoda]|eukprot:XP_011622891.1 uncharacterized protein LOC105420554 [Amborella trichopoda]
MEDIRAMVIAKKHGSFYQKMDSGEITAGSEMRGRGRAVRSWIYGCLSSTHFFILFKGCPSGVFGASRGLRQGDPSSHFLFTIYAECFSRFVQNVKAKWQFVGFLMPNNGLCISHLQYADDILLFCVAKCDQVENIATFLKCCEVALGLKVNFEKSTVMGINCGDGWYMPEIAVIWKWPLPLKIQAFLWLAMQDKVLTIDNLIKRSWDCYDYACGSLGDYYEFSGFMASTF